MDEASHTRLENRVVEEFSRRVVLEGDMASLLAAARPVTWRGKGDLMQLPWAVPPKGTFLLVELWAGMSGLALAMLAVGMTFYAASAEVDATARSCSQAVMPQIVHFESVEKVRAVDFVGLLKRRNIRAIVLGGGSPCQGNSSLNSNRQGLNDVRSCQPQELVRIRDEFEALPEAQGIPILTFLENVASMPESVRKAYSSWLRTLPAVIEAGTMGWVHRRRLFWVSGPLGGLTPSLELPPDWCWSTAPNIQVPQLCYVGSKPVPPRVVWESGFHPLLDPKEVLKQKGLGAIHTFTREFRHPTDRVALVSPAAAARFEQDHRRFPPGSYEDVSLVWREQEWRQPSVFERCQLMGIPPSAVESVSGPPDRRRQQQNSMIGNGFHLPSIVLLLCLLPQLMDAKLPPPLFDVEEVGLASRLVGTVWEPGRLQSFPDLLQAHDIRRLLPVCFPDVPLPATMLQQLEQRLRVCLLSDLQAFSAWCRLRHLPWDQLGPVHVHGKAKAALYAGLGTQRFVGNSSRGLDHLLPPGLGKEEHMKQSAALPSPFQPGAWPDLDVQFVVEAIIVWRRCLVPFTAKLRHVLRTVARAVRPLENHLDGFRCPSSKQVAQSKQPGFLAVMTILMRWPDLGQAQLMVLGYPIVGELPQSSIFRAVPQSDTPVMADWLGPAAQQEVDDIVSRGPPRYHREIHQVTCEEIEKGFCGPFLTKLQVDDLFGPGCWRPFERFMIIQADGKQRCIDNARKSGHNEHTAMFETISTTSVDFIACVTAMVLAAAVDDRSWLQVRLGTDDLPDAYRGLPVHPDHQRFSIISLFVPQQGWRFSLLFGLAFGLESAVVSFNRLPMFGVALARRCALSCAASYYDDQLALEFLPDHNVSQLGVQCAFLLLGAPPQPSKAFCPAANRYYLGTSVHTGDCAPSGMIRFQPKLTTVHKILTLMDTVVETGTMSRDCAGRLRGDLNWMYSMCAGFGGKLAGPLLSKCQQLDATVLQEDDLYTLQLLRQVIVHYRPRELSLLPQENEILRVYSDASFENSELRLGWILFPQDSQPVGGSCLIPPAVLASWCERRQQIFPGESLCGLLVPYFHPKVFGSRDAVWFVDNEGAVAALIKASSSQPDVHRIVQCAQALLQALGSRTWFEWIDSDSNPSDGLSREGLLDSWTHSQDWNLQEYLFPSEMLPDSFSSCLESLLCSENSG